MKTIFIPREKTEVSGEKRVSMIPETVKKILKNTKNLENSKNSFHVFVEKNAGEFSGFSDEEYVFAGAEISDSREDGIQNADIVFMISAPEISDISLAKKGAIFIGGFSAGDFPDSRSLHTTQNKNSGNKISEYMQKSEISEKNISLFSLYQLPRITRAQKMDVLSSQSNLAGYKAVITAANLLPKIFPLMMTAAGTVKPVNVVILGAGVAGLQAIATAKRLGAQVEVSDIRLAAKEQVESLGAKFIAVEGMEDLEDENGYALPPTPEFLARQAEVVAQKIAQADIVISTALIPGRPAPKLISEKMVQSMKKGSVIVDMAAIAGGNCALTEKGKTIGISGVTIVGETNILSELSTTASQLFSANMYAFLEELFIQSGENSGKIDLENEVIEKCLVK